MAQEVAAVGCFDEVMWLLKQTPLPTKPTARHCNGSYAMSRIAEHMAKAGLHDRALQLVEQIPDNVFTVDDKSRGLANLSQIFAALPLHEAKRLPLHSVHIARKISNPFHRGVALSAIATALTRPSPPDAQTMMTEALRLVDRCREDYERPHLLTNLTGAMRRIDIAKSRPLFNRALAMAKRQSNATNGRSWTVWHIIKEMTAAGLLLHLLLNLKSGS